MEPELKLRAASLVTDRVRVEVMAATEALQQIGRSINAFGVFSDLTARAPRARRSSGRRRSWPIRSGQRRRTTTPYAADRMDADARHVS